MDSRLDSIFRTTFRHTESTDTWMGIHREEPRDDHNRRKNDKNEEDDKAQWEDNTSVSIAALKQFLTMLIAPDSAYQAPRTDSLSPIAPQPVPTQVNITTHQQRAHNAARAYQTTAQHNHAYTAPAPQPSPDKNAHNDKLTQEENRIIHQLLNDLEILLQKNVTALTIQKEGSFLESLQRAARTALELHS